MGLTSIAALAYQALAYHRTGSDGLPVRWALLGERVTVYNHSYFSDVAGHATERFHRAAMADILLPDQRDKKQELRAYGGANG
jgi:hypothetical protein